MRTYYVFGNYGYTSECELFSTSNRQEALDFVHNYTRWGDFGGYDVIEVAWFAEDGEYIEELRVVADDSDDDVTFVDDGWEYFSD